MNDNKYMNIALEEAKKALLDNEVPIGTVIVKNDEIIARAHNTKEKNNCVLCHAELLAIQQASLFLNNWRLDECDIYITLEPCPMCASAIRQSRIRSVYYGISNQNLNNEYIINQIFNTVDNNRVVPKVENCNNGKCREILQDFFAQKRKNGK